ncbi:SMP-30/gluconolactonase/LRE family protein [Actinoplanes subglobosus]|uniref:SMP-30/gluconolactonase/LRE family protein n=1 Tax=Actinoplanes subglobosus TaxID=1547892 RepID=A0ABV8J7X9_9ACTN
MERLIAATPLRGSNGITFGPDGRLWVAEYLPGRVSAVDVTTGEVEVVIGPAGPLQSPDDLVFDPDGNLWINDVAPGRVWRRTPAGDLTVAADGLHNPNGIAAVGNRIFVNEMVPGGRVLELADPPKVLAEGLMLGNAMQAGPDGDLYYPHMFPGEVYRVGPDGGTPTLIAEVAQAVAVRFDRNGVLYVLSIDEAGTITRIDGDQRTEIVTGIPGLDNAAFDDANRMFVSSFSSGGITEVLPDGGLREVVPRGLAGPYGIAVDGTGVLHVADHYRLDGAFLPFAHAVATSGDDLHFTSQYGQVMTLGGSIRAENLDQPQGLTVRPDGTLLIAEAGAGRVLAIAPDDTLTVLADGLGRPVDITLDTEGRCYVSDESHGAVYRLDEGKPVLVSDGLQAPQGLTVSGNRLLIAEAGRRRLLALGLDATPDTTTHVGADQRIHVLVEDLPVAVPRPTQPALSIEGLPGVPCQFAALATGPDGTVYLGGSADGSVLRLQFTP